MFCRRKFALAMFQRSVQNLSEMRKMCPKINRPNFFASNVDQSCKGAVHHGYYESFEGDNYLGTVTFSVRFSIFVRKLRLHDPKQCN